MTDDLWEVPSEILAKLDYALGADGFRQMLPGLFVKSLDEAWRAWFGVTGCSVALIPVVGVFNEELLQIARAARQKLGRPGQHPPGAGPPLIMAHLEQIIGDDPDCQKYMTWEYEAKDSQVSDPTSVPDLKSGVVDDLVYCLRKKAYPFFVAHMTYQSIWDAIRAREAMPSPAFRNYFPIMLMKLGRRADVPRFVEEQIRQIKNESVSDDYRKYVDALLDVVPA